MFSAEQIASFERDAKEERANEYIVLRTGPRRWSHGQACAIQSGCHKTGLTGGPVWPMVYRRDALVWLQKRMGAAWATVSDGLSRLTPVITRTRRGEFDILDGREVVALAKMGLARSETFCGPNCLGDVGYVYVMAHEPFADRIKIGKSNNVRYRAHSLSMQAGFQVVPLGSARFCCYEASGRVEKLLHAAYSRVRIIGEWFQADRVTGVEVVALLQSLPKRVSAAERRDFGIKNGAWWDVVQERVRSAAVVLNTNGALHAD